MQKTLVKGIIATLAGAVLLWFTGVAAGTSTVREPVRAGSFYPAAPDRLRSMISEMVVAAEADVADPPAGMRLRALVMPHAGFVYSGPTAAHAAAVLHKGMFASVVLMGPDHFVGFDGCAVSAASAFRTPLGLVPVDHRVQRLHRNPVLFRPVAESDRAEHSLEAVLPFLQYLLGPIDLLPVVVGRVPAAVLAREIRPLLDKDTLLVVSSDLSHYLPYEAANTMDASTIRGLLELDAEAVATGDNRACGRLPLLTLIELARSLSWKPQLLHYANSGDTAGDRQRVVGYACLAFWGEEDMEKESASPGEFSREQGQLLVRLARETLESEFGQGPGADTDWREALSGPAFDVRRGVFVTLKIDNQLRGCIGSLAAMEPVREGVVRNARNAAFRDPRFSKLGRTELKAVHIEVSVLSEPTLLAYEDGPDLARKLRPGIDGVVLRKGRAGATFLPQVWEQLPRTEDFLGHLCRKAGLAADAWKTTHLEVETYQVQYFEE